MHLSSAIPWGVGSGGGGTRGKGGYFVKDPVKVLFFPLLNGGTERSKLRYHIKQHETIVNLKSHYEDPAHVIRRST